VQAPDLGFAQAEHAGQDLVGVLTQHRRASRAQALRAGEGKRRPGHQVGPDAGLVDFGEHGVRHRAARVVLDQLSEGLVRAPRHAVLVERLAQFVQGA